MMSTASIIESSKDNSISPKLIKNNKKLLSAKDPQEQSLDFLNMLYASDPNSDKSETKLNANLEKELLGGNKKGINLKAFQEKGLSKDLNVPAKDEKVLLNKSQLEKLLNPKLNINQNAGQLNATNAETVMQQANVALQDMPNGSIAQKNKLAALKEYSKNMNPKNLIHEKISENTLDSVSNISGDNKNSSSLGQQLTPNHVINTNHNLQISNNDQVSSLADQISQRIHNSSLYKATPMQSEVNLEINHEDLGHLSLNIKKHAKELEINVMTSHNESRQLLSENRDALISQLNNRGISVSDLNIESSVARLADDIKLDNSSKSNNSFNQQQEAKDHLFQKNQSQGEREKRDELWNILKEQREVTYA